MAVSRTLPSRKYGKAVGEAMKARLADVWAARNVTDIPMWSAFHEKHGFFQIPLTQGNSLLFEAGHASDVQYGSSRAIDWSKVTRAKLVEVVCNV